MTAYAVEPRADGALDGPWCVVDPETGEPCVCYPTRGEAVELAAVWNAADAS